MNNPVIVAAVRTAIAKKGGALSGLHPYEYGAMVIDEVIKRGKVEKDEINEVIFGNCLSNAGNIARVSALHAGLDVSVAGLTIDRQCGSGINAVALGAQAIQTEEQVIIVGGTESMTHTPYLLAPSPTAYNQSPPRFLARILTPPAYGDTPMGITAENVAEKYSITREEQDTYALESQRKMKKAMEEGRFEEQILPIEVKGLKGKVHLFKEDEHPRPSITIEDLRKLKPVFKEGGTVTAGTSSGINDGAAALLMMSEQEAKRRGLEPLGRVIASAITGVEPDIMGIGPVPAIRKLLEKTNFTLEDIDLIEINEAFASQLLACQKELKIDPVKLNVSGGAIAHGHPIAATGAILVTKILYELKNRGLKRALVSACIGGGQGIALLVER